MNDASNIYPVDTIESVRRALREAIASVEAAIVRLQGDDAAPDLVEQVLVRAGGPALGDVVALHNTLTRLVSMVDQSGALPDSEWTPVDGAVQLLTAAVRALRAHADAVLGEIESVDASTTESDPESADQAVVLLAAVDEELLGETLQLLVLVEDCATLWHRLALHREGDAALGAARTMLAEHFEQDADLLRRGRRALAGLGRDTLFEALRRLSSLRTTRSFVRFRQDLEDFRWACRADAAGWLDGEDPATTEWIESVDSPVKVVEGAFGRGLAKVAEVRNRSEAKTNPDGPEP